MQDPPTPLFPHDPSAADFRLLADALPALVAYVDSDLVYWFTNRAYEDWLGVAPEQMRGRHVATFIDPQRFAQRKAYFERVLAGTEVRFDAIVPGVDRKPLRIDFRYVPHRGPSGSVDGFFVVGFDVTQRGAREAQVQQENARLAELAAEREALLAKRNAELVELAQHLQTAQERERSRIAREMHDELGAIFTTAKLDATRLKPWLKDEPEARARMQHLAATLDQAVESKRRIIEELRPSSLEHIGVVMPLTGLVRDFGASSQLRVDSHFDPAMERLSPNARLAAYRMVQEALTNIAKYARANTVRITGSEEAGFVVLRIADDGRGFDPSGVAPSCHGLKGMEFRMQAEGGTFTVHSEPGKGTMLTGTLPLPEGKP